MSQETLGLIVALIVACAAVVGLLGSLIISIRNGSLKEFICLKMEEAEAKFTKPEERLQYVLDAVKEKYKLLSLFVNIKKIVESIIALTKKINYKK